MFVLLVILWLLSLRCRPIVITERIKMPKRASEFGFSKNLLQELNPTKSEVTPSAYMCS
jgi:hypothetical protein